MINKEFYIEQKDGSKVLLGDVQREGLKLLEYFDAFCKKHHLQYTLCGGCCIGALRHQGFVPWDDDVDVHMLRSDYEKFYSLWKKETHPQHLRLVRTTKEVFCDTMLMQVSNQNTTFIKENQVHLDIDHGLKLEVIPLDGAPENNRKRKIQLLWALVFYLFNRGFPPKNRGKVAHLVGKIALWLVRSHKTRARVWTYAQKKMTGYPLEESKYVTELCVTWKYMKIRYPKEIFTGERREVFEGREFSVPFQAEKYLSMAFGDYTKLPPVEDQVPKHETEYIDLNQSYQSYKGIYYAKEE